MIPRLWINPRYRRDLRGALLANAVMAAAALLLLLAGCADTAAFRVIEYDASFVSGRAGGCAVHRSKEQGKETFVLQYNGERCAVRVIAQ